VIRSKLIRRAVVGLGAAALPLGIAVVGTAAPASADPNLCVSGPYGFAYACVDTPNWVDWHDGHRGRGWHKGHHDHDD
jgi:hypothetical protein